MYFGTRQLARSRSPAPEPMVLEADVMVGHEVLSMPLLSARFWPIAFRIVLRLAWRWVLRAWANCFAGLIATMTMAARMAMMPMTMRISMRVKPFIAVFLV